MALYSRSKVSENLRHKQLQSFLVSTRTILLNTKHFFEHDGRESTTSKQIKKAMETIDIAGRELDKDKTKANYRRFRS